MSETRDFDLYENSVEITHNNRSVSRWIRLRVLSSGLQGPTSSGSRVQAWGPTSVSEAQNDGGVNKFKGGGSGVPILISIRVLARVFSLKWKRSK